jgi:hypothetical protein
LNLSDLAPYFRLYNFFRKSGAAEDKTESFIAHVSTGDISPERVVEHVNQLYQISKEESIPLDNVSSYVNKKIEEKKNIEEELREADTCTRTKVVVVAAAVMLPGNIICKIFQF